MASEVKILEALFGPSIPTEKAALLPEIMAHIRAIDDLLQGKTRQRARPRISDPAISGPINRRIVELYAEIGKDWPKIAAAICQEFQVRISPDACRGRHKDAVARQEAYAALSGSAIQAGQYITPPVSGPVRTSPAKELPTELPMDSQPVNVQDSSARQETDAALHSAARLEDVQLPATFGQLIPRDAPVDKPAQQVAQRPYDRQIEAIKAEAFKLYQEEEGRDLKCIAEHLGVRAQWLRGILTPVGAPEPNSSASPDSAAGNLEIPANCNRAELDAVMWQLWDHGKGKTPDEISDILVDHGYSYGTAAVERRLRQQGAEL